MSQSGAFLRNLNRGDTELRNIITKITNLSSFTRNGMSNCWYASIHETSTKNV